VQAERGQEPTVEVYGMPEAHDRGDVTVNQWALCAPNWALHDYAIDAPLYPLPTQD
jgi:hypothetical protein